MGEVAHLPKNRCLMSLLHRREGLSMRNAGDDQNEQKENYLWQTRNMCEWGFGLSSGSCIVVRSKDVWTGVVVRVLICASQQTENC
jgi:hypothetical protein